MVCVRTLYTKMLSVYGIYVVCVIICSETVIVVVSDFFTAFYAGLVVFSCIGFMAKESGISVQEAAMSSGYMLDVNGFIV